MPKNRCTSHNGDKHFIGRIETAEIQVSACVYCTHKDHLWGMPMNHSFFFGGGGGGGGGGNRTINGMLPSLSLYKMVKKILKNIQQRKIITEINGCFQIFRQEM